MSQTLLVSGAGGQFGRLVVENLLAANAGTIVAGSRNPDKLADFADRGVELRTVDFDDPAGLEAAFAGVDRLLIISTDALDTPGRRLAQHTRAIEAAKAAGVGHIVYTSMPSPEPGNPVLFAPDHFGTEQAIKASGIPYTILRNNWYFENLLMSLPGSLKSGQVVTAAGDGRIAYIGRADLALAAATALAATTGNSTTLTLSGSENLSTAEIAALAAEVFETPLAVINVTDAQLLDGLKAHGVPEGFAALIVSFDANARAGGLEGSSADFEALTGRKPGLMRDWLAANTAAFA
ncbi:SDR family oxidoreductase [Methylobrevis pamukkalensis]|uniref:Quinone oxidoreductase 2 n=1 Tax=Methylobrevis pamukkalensis TaxID=1439726 RepID=A0A1E3GZN1_9HYPH|nr:SDR family oxidoreductase [Methylobrevis pamukkalensis]ODN69538.1 Quinone oxidoreductase 2 [Methylobrevis pamukkalensis]